MCTETFDVVGLDDQRTAYEVEQYLTGLPYINDVQADFLTDQVTVDYDESTVNHNQVLDEIEYSGCKPCDRLGGIVDRLRMMTL